MLEERQSCIAEGLERLDEKINLPKNLGPCRSLTILPTGVRPFVGSSVLGRDSCQNQPDIAEQKCVGGFTTQLTY